MAHPTQPSSFALRGITLFEGLGTASLDRIAADCEWRPLQARQPVFNRCSTGSDVFFLVSGRVRITTYSPGGREVSFRDYGPGEHFGDLAAIDGQARSTDVVTLESSLLASLSRQDFLALLAREPAIALRMMEGLAGLVRRLTDRVMELSTLGVPTRLHRSCCAWRGRRAYRPSTRPSSAPCLPTRCWPARSAPTASRSRASWAPSPGAACCARRGARRCW